MSESAKLTGAPRTDVLPGFTLAHARLPDFAAVEDELARRHVALAGAAAVGLPENVATMMIGAATDDVAAGRFKYGRAAFDAHVKSLSFTPFLLFLATRHAHPELTRDAVGNLVTRENEVRVNRAVLELFGYEFSAAEDASKKGAAASGSGPQSLPPAANADSPTTTSTP